MGDELNRLPHIRKSTLDKLERAGVTSIQEYFAAEPEEHLTEQEFLEVDFLIVAELLRRSAEAIEGQISQEEVERMRPLYEIVGASSMRELASMKHEELLSRGISDDDAHWLIGYAGRVFPIYEKAGIASLPELAAMQPDALVRRGFSEDEANSMIETAKKLHPK